MNSQTRKRRYMIQRIKNTIRDAEGKEEGIEYKKLVAAICLDADVSIRTSREYLKILIDGGEIILHKGKIYPNELKGGESENGAKTT